MRHAFASEHQARGAGYVPEDELLLSTLGCSPGWGTESIEHLLKNLRNFQWIAALDVAAMQHIYGLPSRKRAMDGDEGG